MPWASTSRPSIALGILEQLCEEAGVAHDSFYFNLDTAAEIGTDAASLFADCRGLFGVSEHLFAADLFGPAAIHSDVFLETFLQSDRALGDGRELAWLRTLRD